MGNCLRGDPISSALNHLLLDVLGNEGTPSKSEEPVEGHRGYRKSDAVRSFESDGDHLIAPVVDIQGAGRQIGVCGKKSRSVSTYKVTFTAPPSIKKF
jgi:hypothetical protein